MTKVSNIFDKIESIVQTQFSSKQEIPNPFEIEKNPDDFLRDGYGFRYGPGSSGGSELNNLQEHSRDFIIVFTKLVFRTDSDKALFKSTQKAMLEDQYTLIDSLAKDTTMDSDLTRLEFVGDGGIEFVYSGRQTYLKLESTFEIAYWEDTTYNYP